MIPATLGTEVGRDLRAARASRGGADSQRAASSEPCPEGGGHGGVTRADAGGQRPANPSGPEELPAAPFVSRSTFPRRAGGRRPEQAFRSREQDAGGGAAPRPASRSREPARAHTQREATPALPGPMEARVVSPERAGGQEGAASAFPHLGGSERPRVTAPYLAGPHPRTDLPAWGGAPRWRRRRILGLREADSGEGTRESLAFLLHAGEVHWARES